VALRDDEIEDVLDMLERHEKGVLNQWETGFLENIREQWDRSQFLTDNQRAKLDELAERAARRRG
jgi:hypothetical protein